MKNFRNITITVIGMFFLVAFTEATGIYKPAEKVSTLESLKTVEIKTEIEIPEMKIEVKDHIAFLDAIGYFESSNRYDIVNRFGYMGKYQFGSSTLQSLNINVSRKTFLNSPDLQEEAMDRLLVNNFKSLRRYIYKYEGKYVHGVYITKSGVLAAAHLAGAGNVRKFFRKGYEFKDGNGTKMTSYMKIFSGYELDI